MYNDNRNNIYLMSNTIQTAPAYRVTVGWYGWHGQITST